MDDGPHLPPNTTHYLFDLWLADAREDARRSGSSLRFVVSQRDGVGYELAAKYVDSRGEPHRRRLQVDRDRNKLEQIRAALEAQEPGSN